jgi:hypothetical protein
VCGEAGRKGMYAFDILQSAKQKDRKLVGMFAWISAVAVLAAVQYNFLDFHVVLLWVKEEHNIND